MDTIPKLWHVEQFDMFDGYIINMYPNRFTWQLILILGMKTLPAYDISEIAASSFMNWSFFFSWSPTQLLDMKQLSVS